MEQNEIFEEIAKQKVKLNIKQKEELIEWLGMKQEILRKFSSDISECDEEINKHIYHLYNLNQNEVSIIKEILGSS